MRASNFQADNISPRKSRDIDPIIDEIESFSTGTRPTPTGNRVLATVLAIRLVSPVEIELRENDFAGLTIHIAESIASKAHTGETLVSGVVADLVAGSGLHFQEHGSQTIDGISWRTTAACRDRCATFGARADPANRKP